MDWKLIFGLSLFALGMGVGTVFVIPSNIEPIFWLAIFIICAFIIARRRNSGHFAHGFLLGIVNCVWVTGAHILLFHQYIANHPKEAAMMSQMPLPHSPRVMMAIAGAIIGVVSGLVIGLFAYVAGKLVRPRVSSRPEASFDA